jgi:hypothetical protein
MRELSAKVFRHFVDEFSDEFVGVIINSVTGKLEVDPDSQPGHAIDPAENEEAAALLGEDTALTTEDDIEKVLLGPDIEKPKKGPDS